MRYSPVQSNQGILAQQLNLLAGDAAGASNLLAHQTLGLFALGTNPTASKTVTLTINTVAVTITFVSTIGSTPGNVLIAGTAAGSVANLLNLLNNPQVTNANQVALSGANQALVGYLDYDQSGTNLAVSSVNNLTYAPLTAFTATTNVTSGTWTASTMKLYVEDGICFINGVEVYFTGGMTPTVTAPTVNPRIDLLTIDNTGALAWVAGVEGIAPATPAYPNNKLVICELKNVVGETQLLDNLNQSAAQGFILNDSRPFLQSAFFPLAFGSSFTPDIDATRDLGGASFRWNNLYAAFVHGDGSGLTNVPISNITQPLLASEAVGAHVPVCLRPLQTDGGAEFDTGGTGNASGANGTVNNISVTIGANSNRLLFVTVSTTNSNGAFTITHNGNAPSATLQSNIGVGSSSGTWTYIWFNPTSGTHNIAVTIGNSNALTYNVAYLSLYNINQTSQPSQSSAPLGGTPASAATITTATSGSIVVMVAGGQGGSVTATNPVNPQSNSTAYVAWSEVIFNTGSVFSISRTAGAGANGAWEFQPAASVTGFGAGLASSLNTSYRYNLLLGLTVASAAIGGAVTVSVAGVITGLSGLTPGADYYLNDTLGSMGTSPGTNTRKIGFALSTTSMFLTTNF